MSQTEKKSIIFAFVGMPGAGKSEAAQYLQKKDIPLVRFGQFTEDVLKKQGLPLTPQNEQVTRENVRKEYGMDIFARNAVPQIKKHLEKSSIIIVDGLYSWEEYILLKKEFPNLILIHIFAEPAIRYQRLSERVIRPFTLEEAHTRDFHEIEKLSKGGPIAISDVIIENDGDLENLHKGLDELLKKYDTN